MWDLLYSMEKVVAMMETGVAGPAAAQELRDNVESLNGAENERNDDDYDATLKSAESPLTSSSSWGHAWQGRKHHRIAVWEFWS